MRGQFLCHRDPLWLRKGVVPFLSPAFPLRARAPPGRRKPLQERQTMCSAAYGVGSSGMCWAQACESPNLAQRELSCRERVFGSGRTMLGLPRERAGCLEGSGPQRPHGGGLRSTLLPGTPHSHPLVLGEGASV